ncbi:MAG TPA: dienelactone hydrolase family protein [Thermoanaerobaculia bacterium]|nr:dienelactone hydrolase family protein [Thermoanaerobaculia bacterium]
MLKSVLRVPSAQPDDVPLPLVLVMHGRGADANDLADLAPMLDPPGGARFVFPNAPKPFEAAPGMTFGYSWFDGWPPRGQSMQESRALILELIDDLVERYPTPPGKLIVSGFSQGGLMSIDAGFRTKQEVAGIVVMSGAIAESDMPDFAAKKDVPVLIVHGTADDMIPVLAARRARRILEQHGIEPEYHEFPMGHHVTPESMEVVRNFMAARLLQSPTT